MEMIQNEVQNATRFEAVIGLGVSTIIMNFVVQSALNGIEMPVWAIVVLVVLIMTIFINRLLLYLRYYLESVVAIRRQKALLDVQNETLLLQIKKLELERDARDG